MTAGIVGFMVDATYLGIIVGQHEADGRVALFAVYLFAVSMLSLFAAFTPTSPPARLVLLGAAKGGFLTAGVHRGVSLLSPLFGGGGPRRVRWARVAQ